MVCTWRATQILFNTSRDVKKNRTLEGGFALVRFATTGSTIANEEEARIYKNTVANMPMKTKILRWAQGEGIMMSTSASPRAKR